MRRSGAVGARGGAGLGRLAGALARAAVIAGLAAATLGGAGCAAATKTFGDTGEYGLYRRARGGPTLDDRLQAASLYLERHPEGPYAEELRGFVERVEPLYFARTKYTIDGLEAYLTAMPRGKHAKEAALRLRDRRAALKADRTDLAGAGATIDAAVAFEVDRRKNVGERVEQWIGLFLDPEAFAAPMADAKAAVVVPWSLALPWPLCARRDGGGPDAPKGGPQGAARRCAKLLQLDYRAVEDGAPQERQALVEVSMWQDEAGRPLEVSIGGPDLFLRLEEAGTARGVDGSDPEVKLRGAERAVALATKVFGARVSADTGCRKAADSDVLRLACEGVELRVLAGALDGEDDRFVVRPAR